MNVGAALILLLGSSLVLSAAFTPLLATSPDSPLVQGSTLSRSKTPPSSAPAAFAAGPLKSGASPQSIPGQPVVDANTIALYHFDLDATDATGQHNGTMQGGAQVTSNGLYSGALHVDGMGSYVSIPAAGNLTAMSQGTIEAFVDFSSACPTAAEYFNIISAGAGYGSGIDVMALRVQVGLTFGIYANGQWQWVDSGINPCRYLNGPNPPSGPLWPYETWRFHHVAGTWGPRGVEIWVDGVLHGVGNHDPNAGIQPYPYMCNPQMQMGSPGYPANPRYPVCLTPVMAPTMTVYPPGDYLGGLPSFNSLLIGCDSSGSCFNGRIDEVRLSNIQRTFDWTVDPTSTPTPTQTPVPLSAAYTMDSNTRALYHLDYSSPSGFANLVYNEATGLYDASYSGNGAIVPTGRFNAGLSIFGGVDSYGLWPQLTTGNPGDLGNGTIEAWVKLDNLNGGLTVFNGSSSLIGGSLQPRVILGTHYPVGNIGFGVDDGGAWVWTDSKAVPQDFLGAWHHIAGTWGARGLELWVDGKLCSSYPFYGAMYLPIAQYGVGCDSHGNCTRGTFDEVRISSLQRTFVRAGFGMSPPRNLAAGSNPSIVFLPFIALAPTPVGIPCSPF